MSSVETRGARKAHYRQNENEDLTFEGNLILIVSRRVNRSTVLEIFIEVLYF